ncbi:MAG: sulfite exporter TauE/SafE family protein [Rhodospirillaceae bacterium]|nr:sulfite exporter TauE/SafE family protein [Rhodospirillaceae bacterium]
MSRSASPPVASASVHAAEVFTTGISGIAHWRFGNVRWRMMLQLALPGMAGGVVGAYLLTHAPLHIIAPTVAIYLLLMGAWILRKAFHKRATPRRRRVGGADCRLRR